MASRARKIAMNDNQENYERSFELIEPWLQGLKDNNKDTKTVFLRDKDGRFAAGGYVLGAVADIVKECALPMGAMDATHFVNGQYKGKILILEAQFPSGTILPVAIIIHHGEIAAAYKLLLGMVFEVPGMKEYMNSSSFTIISDRGSAVLAAIEECLPHAHSLWCCIHLFRNSIDFGGEYRLNQFMKIVDASTPDDFQEALDELRATKPKAAQYLENQTPYEKWQQHYLTKAGARRWGRTTSNAVEVENGRAKIEGIRSGTPLNALMLMESKQLDVITKLQKEADKVTKLGSVLIPCAVKMYETNSARASKCEVTDTSEKYVYHVRDTTKHHSTARRVDLSKPFERHGHCVSPHDKKLPCKHVIAASRRCLLVLHAEYAPNITTSQDFLLHVHDPCYRAARFCGVFQGDRCVINLVDDELLERDAKTLPTVAYSQAERKKAKPEMRIPSRGENPKRSNGDASTAAEAVVRANDVQGGATSSKGAKSHEPNTVSTNISPAMTRLRAARERE
ncbi:hypothetical protein RI054_35g135150 [Pseudoscourfieldia marina]